MIKCNKRAVLPKIASILDDFSYTCFKYEANLISLDAEKWEDTLICEKPDLLFIESAWNQSFTKLFRLNYKGVNSSQSVVDWCKKHNIPTVFWNKEDPFHFNHFIKIAKNFDYIFTTDSDCIPRYKAITGHDRVYLLPFAAQISIHNPINKDAEKLGKVAFAGTWYQLHPLRQKDMEMLFNPALKYGLHIYDRMHNFTINKHYQFPKMYQPYIKGYLPYEEMVSTYKKYDIFLNVNIVKESPTMMSRRVIELLACGINVISNDSLAVKNMFPGIVQLCNTEEDAERHLNILIKDKNLRDRLSLLGQREVFQKHTYTHRMETISKIVGLKYNCEEDPGVSIISVVNRQHFMESIIANFKRQKYPHKELIIIIDKSSINLQVWEDRIKPDNNMKICLYEEQKTPANCINDGVSRARFDYISFFEESNYYAPDFIGDLMNAFRYSRAEIVGKCTYYTYLEDVRAFFIRFPDKEYRYVDSLLGSAMIVKKEIMEKVKLVDTTERMFPTFSNIFPAFLNECLKNGLKIYSADRFNFVYINSINSSAALHKLFSQTLKKCPNAQHLLV
ncbi:glycosyltransferase family protein [Phosphitispora fastidiosa]|uniref:glycosyltransferase family protein n=1 Tax=Phosphitispora fastidiosa TaxID=2837202 RepID=UPI001E299F97|nr:glycosyltransferase [Phosphitispora fastidiosa]MBU7008551.1 spore maturation protein CgeB [Phosphitispora fastidiosa]